MNMPLPPATSALDQQRRIAQSNEYYECMARVASRALQAPAAAIVDFNGDRRELRAGVGLQSLGIAEELSFLAAAMTGPDPLVVGDLSLDPRFSKHPLVDSFPSLRFYAGISLTNSLGLAVGALCVVDSQARWLSAESEWATVGSLQDIGGLIEHEMLMRSLMGTDPLTGLHSASYAMTQIDREWRRAHRGRYPMAVLMIDVDHLGTYNDVFGYPAGDRAMRDVAETLGALFRRSHDMLVRVGGDRILALLPQTEIGHALALADSSRQQIEALAIGNVNGGTRITISIGCATLDGDADRSGGWEALLRRADTAMRQAKQSGGNQVVVGT